MGNEIRDDIHNCLSKNRNLLIDIGIIKQRFPIKWVDGFFYMIRICPGEMPHSSFKSNLASITWWWELECNKRWAPGPITILGCDVISRSMQDFELSKIWVSSLITWDNTDCEARNSLYESLKLVMTFKYQLLDLPLKSPIITVRNRLLVDSASRFISRKERFVINTSTSSILKLRYVSERQMISKLWTWL